ncbi:BglG family transcription antiterminator [Spiroplasma alleghenense]|uniref:PTS system, mannitol-specific IIA component n=1 Tax=Spiroplasma alleghenense TaxID=216931 RepID=A0A345Z2W6_9MOLU|nr:PTS sugar transporter subunit IIA [Spiroplasma alleghenense]AXK50945.1 PTS system, mannitol-specific IIA component [Spiroplasma alleghenense]
MNSDRNEQIIYLLLNYKTILVSQLSQKFMTSEKTILRAIVSVNVFLKNYNLIVENNEGLLTLVGDTSLIWKKFDSDKEVFTKYERLIYIFNHFLKTDEKITISDLATDLEVPVTQIKNDFKDLDGILINYDIKIESDLKTGFKINLNFEYQRYAIFIDLIFMHFLSRQTVSFIKAQDVKVFFNSYVYKILKKNYQINNFNAIYLNLIHLIKDEGIEWNEIDTILLAMLITIWLNSTENQELYDDYNSDKNFSLKTIIKKIIILRDENHLIERFNQNNIKFEKNVEIKNCINEIQKLTKKLLDNDMNLDKEIYLSMYSHLQNSLNGTNDKYDLQIKNYVSGIQNYIDQYKHLWNCLNQIINKYFEEDNIQEQITYGIFIYIVVWLDTQLYKLPMKILTVCIGGMGQSKMLATHLKTIYKNAEIEALPFAFINNKILNEYDLVISSIEITNTKNKNTLHLPVIFSVENKVIIHKKLNEIFYQHKIEKSYIEMQSILKKENILINLPSESKTEAIIRAGEKLVELGYVKPEYIKSMLNREAKITTYIGNKIAIPHGEDGSQNMIIKSGIVILHYKEPVNFAEPVNFIVGIASNNNLHLEILANIADKFSEIEKVDELLKNPTIDLLFNEFRIGE